MTNKIAEHLQNNGEELQKIAGDGGDPFAADLAQAAKAEAGSLFDSSTGWGMCQREYIMLIELYKKAKPLYDADFTFAKELQKAEDAILMMNGLKTKLHKCAKEAEDPILATYPFYFEFMAALDEKALQDATDKYANALVDYYPAIYYANK